MKKTIVIGVAGGSSSGKTTLANKLYEAFQGEASMISHDSYYKAHYDMTFEERKANNYDHPNSLDTELMVEDIKKLLSGESVNIPTYSFTDHQRMSETTLVCPNKIIIVEGILIFENMNVVNLCDIKLYVDTDDDIRFIRRLTRDVVERGRSMESVVTQYLTTVKPMHNQFVEPSKRHADLIIPEGGHNAVAVNMIIDGIRKKL